jgi:hypothetical protein
MMRSCRFGIRGSLADQTRSGTGEAEDNNYRIEKVNAFVLPGETASSFDDKPRSALTADDVEAFRAARAATSTSTFGGFTEPWES